MHCNLAAYILYSRMWHCLQTISNVMYVHQKVAQKQT